MFILKILVCFFPIEYITKDYLFVLLCRSCLVKSKALPTKISLSIKLLHTSSNNCNCLSFGRKHKVCFLPHNSYPQSHNLCWTKWSSEIWMKKMSLFWGLCLWPQKLNILFHPVKYLPSAVEYLNMVKLCMAYFCIDTIYAETKQTQKVEHDSFNAQPGL